MSALRLKRHRILGPMRVEGSGNIKQYSRNNGDGTFLSRRIDIDYYLFFTMPHFAFLCDPSRAILINLNVRFKEDASPQMTMNAHKKKRPPREGWPLFIVC